MTTGVGKPSLGRSKVVVTGASGALGSHVIAALIARDAVPVLIGRDPASLAARFPDCESMAWDQLESAVSGAAAVIHLAVRNNDVGGTFGEFCETNVALTERVAAACRREHVRLIFPSTFRAFAPGESDHYARSKRLGEQAVQQAGLGEFAVVRLPAVTSEAFAGRLAPLNRLPAALRPIGPIGSLRPEVDAGEAAEWLAAAAMSHQTIDINSVEPDLVFTDKQANPWFQGVKRALDLMAATVIILTLWWFVLAVWLVIRITSPGPGLFVQQRVGRLGKTFMCYKFRTMQVGTPQEASHLVSRSAVTPVGQFLRRFKLDELPQVVNLVDGSMTLVGPRPCLPTQTELIAARQELGVDTLVPGITGYAQVRDIDMSDPQRLARADYLYKARRSLIEDARIILATLRGRGMADRTDSTPAS